jgi:hypothetical protein
VAVRQLIAQLRPFPNDLTVVVQIYEAGCNPVFDHAEIIVDPEGLVQEKLLEPRPEEDWREETKQNPAAKLLKPRTGSG